MRTRQITGTLVDTRCVPAEPGWWAYGENGTRSMRLVRVLYDKNCGLLYFRSSDGRLHFVDATTPENWRGRCYRNGETVTVEVECGEVERPNNIGATLGLLGGCHAEEISAVLDYIAALEAGAGEQPMTDAETAVRPDVEAIGRRHIDATWATWEASRDAAGVSYLVRTSDNRYIAINCEQADAEFIAHAHQDVPALLQWCERLERENQRLRGQQQDGEDAAPKTLTVDDICPLMQPGEPLISHVHYWVDTAEESYLVDWRVRHGYRVESQTVEAGKVRKVLDPSSISDLLRVGTMTELSALHQECGRLTGQVEMLQASLDSQRKLFEAEAEEKERLREELARVQSGDAQSKTTADELPDGGVSTLDGPDPPPGWVNIDFPTCAGNYLVKKGRQSDWQLCRIVRKHFRNIFSDAETDETALPSLFGLGWHWAAPAGTVGLRSKAADITTFTVDTEQVRGQER